MPVEPGSTGWTSDSPAGWYETVDGRAWWDGNAWRTDFESSGGGAVQQRPPAPTVVAPARPAKPRAKRGCLVAAIAISVIFTGGTLWVLTAARSETNDPSADMACIEWTGVVVNATNGASTDEEIRAQLHEVYLDSLGSDDLEGPATDLIAGANQGRVDEDAARRMTAACNARS